MTRTIFRDFDEFADAIHGIAGRFIPTARSQMDWWVQVVPVGRVPVQQIQIGGASTFAGDGTHRALTLGLPLTSSQRIRIDGQELEENSLILVKEGQPFTFAARQATRWAGITVPLGHASLSPELLRFLTAAPFGGRRDTHVQTALADLARAKMLVSRLCANDGALALLEPAASRAAEEDVMSVTSRILEESSTAAHRRLGRPPLPRGRVLATALALIRENDGRPLFISDLCRTTRVSERTLRNVFQEYVGVGPIRFLKVRQLRQIRVALLASRPDHQSVAGIAARLGVWDLGAFTRTYKSLYGETPWMTLHSDPGARSRSRRRALDMTWIRYASRKFQEGLDERRL